MSEQLIADIEKNALERLRAHIDTCQGNQYIDIRIWHRKNASDGEAYHLTERGARFHVALLPGLIEGLEKILKGNRRG